MGWQGYGKRIMGELLALQARTGQRLTLAWLGARIADLEHPRRDAPYDASTVKKWIDETREPPLRAFEAMARLFGHASEAYLTHGRDVDRNVDRAGRAATPEPPGAAAAIPRPGVGAKKGVRRRHA